MKVQNRKIGSLILRVLLWAIAGGIIIALFAPSACASIFDRIKVSDADVYYPKPTGFVVDSSDVLSDEIEKEITAEAEAFKENAEVVVVTVETTQPLTIEQYALNLAVDWGIGDADRDNGVLLLLVTGDGHVRIEVGTGLEGDITDSKAGRILDNYVVVPMKAGDWDLAAVDGFRAIKAEISGEAYESTASVVQNVVGTVVLLLIILAVLVILVVLIETGGGGYGGGFGTFGGGSSSSGGFGGFGGGGFSGGGASR